MTGYFTRQKLLLKHFSIKRIVLYCFFLLMSASLTSGKAMVSLKLIQYKNPSHREITGQYCKWFDGNVIDHDMSNNHFSLCIDEISRSDIMDFCAFLKMDYFYLAKEDEFFFPSTFEFYGGNPLVFEVPNYRGGFQVKIDIWDTSTFHENYEGHIDFYKHDIYARPSFTNPSYHMLYGRGHSTIKIAVNVSCASDFYDEKCSTYCTTNESNSERNYTCDPLTGAKVFRPLFEELSPDTGCSCTPWFWLLIGISTGFVLGILLKLYSCKAHVTKHREGLETLKSSIKYEKLLNSETII